MALGSSDVYSPANPGLATVLGSGMGPLRIVQQEYARHYREQQAANRLKLQQEQADARNLSFAGDTKGWLPHNEELAAMKKNAYAKMLAIGVDPSLSLIERKARQQETWDEVVSAAEKSRQLNKAYTERLGLSSDKRYDKRKLETALYDAAYATDESGARRPKTIAESDASMFDAVTGSRGTYNEDEVLKQFIKAESDKENERFGTAARPGGTGTTNTFVSDIFASKNGRQVFNADGSPAIRDINALIQRAHADPFMAAILRDNAQKREAEAGSAAMMSYAQLTPEQNAALNGIRPVGTAERVDLADLVTRYGKAKSSSVQTYRNPIKSSAAGKPGFTVNAPADYAPGVSGGDSAPTQTPFSTFFGEPALAVPSSQKGLYSPARRPQPTYATKTNPAKNFEFKGLPSNEVLQPGPDGSLTHVRNNSQPIFGVPQEGVTLLRNSKTGELKHGADSQAGFERQLRELGPEWKLEPAVQVAVPKNKNYAAESAQVMARLTAREAAKAESQEGYIPKTTDQLEKEAFDLASGGTVQTYLPYNKSTRGSIDAQTAGAYREYADNIVPQAEQRIRSAQPKARANPLGFTPKAAPSSTPKTKTVGKNNALGF